MKKITFLMLHLNYGGIERQVTTLVNNLCNDYDIEIISLYNLLNGKSFYTLDPKVKVKYIFDFGPNKKEIKKALKNLKIFSFFKELNKAIKILYTKYFGMKKIVRELDSDIIISSRIEFSKQIKKEEAITIAQEHSYIDTKKYIKKVKKYFKGIDYLVVMTNKAKEKYEEWLKDTKNKTKIVVIPNMIKENYTNQISTLDNNQIISIGRLEDVKDFPTLINIFYNVQKKNKNIILKIIGDGSKKEELKNLVNKLQLDDKVVFTGRLEEKEINEELLKSDIFVLTSKSESFSLVLCEAMNYGIPCISFDIDVGPREIISDSLNGYLIENREVSQMQEKIELLLDNSESRKMLGKNAFKRAKDFYPDKIIDRWKSLF